MSNRWGILAVLGIGVMLAVAACGGSGGGGDAASAAPTAAATVAPSLAASATPTATVTPAPTATPALTATPTPIPTRTPAPRPTATLAPTPTLAPRPTATPVPVFVPGVYYRQPAVVNPGGALAILGGGLPALAMAPGGFDVRADRLVFSAGADRLMIVAPNGDSRMVLARGLSTQSRPSLSPDGRMAVVQGSEDPAAALVQGGALDALNIYVVDLTSGTWRRISNRPVNEESPEWFPRSNRIAYSSFSPTEGVNLHVYDLDAQREVLTALDGGGIHLAVSPDERAILEPGRMRLYDATTGAQTADLRAAAIAGVRGAGYEMDTRFRGQANRGTFPLDGTFSPDGRTIVFDGAVRRGSEYGIVMAQISVTGTDFRMLSDLIAVNAAFSNNNNYSQLNPVWLGPA